MTASSGPAPYYFGSISLSDEPATVKFGQALAELARNGDVILLAGDLGAGKTALARALIQTLCGASTEVPSPTFTLVQDYDSPFGPIHHFDLYRIEHPDEALEIGFEDALGDGVCLIEWPDRLAGLLPHNALRIDLTMDGHARFAKLSAKNETWRERLASIEHTVKLSIDPDA